jgi:nucleotide-binding universal stress UspA family protein
VRYLVATDSVHTTAAACDYLEPRLDPDDEVDVLTVVAPNDDAAGADGAPGSPSSNRDAGDAGNVAAARLAGRATVETLVREGEPAGTVRSVGDRRDADVVLVGVHGGRPGAGPGLGSVARSVLEGADRPVVVLPLPSLGGNGEGV